MVLPPALEGNHGKGKLQYVWFLIKSIAVHPWPVLHRRDIGVQLSGCVCDVREQAQIQTHQLATVCFHMGLKRAVLGCGEGHGACCRTLSHHL